MEHLSHDICIIGAGISGLALATFLQDLRPEADLILLEKNTQAGGAIATHADNGWLAEWGPHGFLDNCAESKELIRLAGIENQVSRAPLNDFVRYVCQQGKLACIPQKPLAIIREPLISWPEKIRVLGDMLKAPLPDTPHEPSVAQWVKHRFGSALLPFADAVFTGTYAGDINRLKIDGVMPGVRQLEKQHGSVIRGVLAKMRQKAKEKKQAGRPTTPKGLPAMTSFSSGMATLPQALAGSLVQQGRLHLQTEVEEITRHEQGWQVTCKDKSIQCRQIILATSINASLALLGQALPKTPPPCTRIPTAHIATVLLGFGPEAEIPFGFGYLAPEQEQRYALGALFSTHMFPGRAPAGHQLLEVLVGGRRHPERLQAPDEELITQAWEDIRTLMPLPQAPSYTKVLRPQAGIPQFEEGYTDLLNWRSQVIKEMPNIDICGFGWKGIGINDMIKEAKQVSERIVEQSQHEVAPEVKKIYF